MQYAPTRIRAKPARFHISTPGCTQNPPDFTLPNRDTPKTRPVLDANPCRRIFGGVCNTPLHGYTQKIVRFHITPSGYTKNLPGFSRKPLSQDISGRMLLRPTRVRAKPARFHISAHEYAKNAPDFTFPNKDSPKTRPILGPNLRRKTFRGICNTPLHRYMKNLSSFIFPHMYPPKTHPVSSFPIGIHRKPTRF